MNNSIISKITYFEWFFFFVTMQKRPPRVRQNKVVPDPNGRDSFTLQRRRLGAETLL